MLLIVLEAFLLQTILAEEPVLLAYDHQLFLPVHVLTILIAIVILLTQESLMAIKLNELLFCVSQIQILRRRMEEVGWWGSLDART